MTTWIKIEDFQCPGKDCKEKKLGKTWVCSKDSTPIYLSQTGYLRCDKVENYNTCNDATKYSHYDKLCNWGWDCGSSDHSCSKSMKTNKDSFILSMSLAMQMVKGKGKAKWLAALIMELGNQFGDEDSDDDLK